jgi:hypothetical protein
MCFCVTCCAFSFCVRIRIIASTGAQLFSQLTGIWYGLRLWSRFASGSCWFPLGKIQMIQMRGPESTSSRRKDEYLANGELALPWPGLLLLAGWISKSTSFTHPCLEWLGNSQLHTPFWILSAAEIEASWSFQIVICVRPPSDTKWQTWNDCGCGWPPPLLPPPPSACISGHGFSMDS